MRIIPLLLAALLLACDQPSVTVRVAEPLADTDLPLPTGAPSQFRVPADASSSVGSEVGKCPAVLEDPRGGVRLRILRGESSSIRRRSGDTLYETVRGHGDYAVEPAGTFGVGAGKVLRVDCATYAPLGIAEEE